MPPDDEVDACVCETDAAGPEAEPTTTALELDEPGGGGSARTADRAPRTTKRPMTSLTT
jgi:hypothetical protein